MASFFPNLEAGRRAIMKLLDPMILALLVRPSLRGPLRLREARRDAPRPRLPASAAQMCAVPPIPEPTGEYEAERAATLLMDSLSMYKGRMTGTEGPCIGDVKLFTAFDAAGRPEFLLRVDRSTSTAEVVFRGTQAKGLDYFESLPSKLGAVGNALLVSLYIAAIVGLFITQGFWDALLPITTVTLKTVVFGVSDFKRDLEYLTTTADCFNSVEDWYSGSEKFGLSKDTRFFDSLIYTFSRALRNEPLVHRGFATRAIKYEPWVEGKLQQLYGPTGGLHSLKKIYVSGHSLGGAAALAFADCMRTCVDVKQTKVFAYVFSAPNIGNRRWQEDYRDALGENTYQHSLAGDPVPYFPPWLWKVGSDLTLRKRSGTNLEEWPTSVLGKHIKVDRGLIPYLDHLLNEKNSSFLEVAKKKYGGIKLEMEDGTRESFEKAFDLDSIDKGQMKSIHAAWTPSGQSPRPKTTLALAYSHLFVLFGSVSWTMVLLWTWLTEKVSESEALVTVVTRGALDLLNRGSPVLAFPIVFLFISISGKLLYCDYISAPRNDIEKTIT
ncbi:MAG: hypothetical protein SGPRY_006847 [Prymnesium sp.]